MNTPILRCGAMRWSARFASLFAVHEAPSARSDRLERMVTLRRVGSRHSWTDPGAPAATASRLRALGPDSRRSDWSRTLYAR